MAVKPSEQLKLYAAGQREGISDAVKSWARLQIYKTACQCLDAKDTRAALAALPEHIRSEVRTEAIRLYKLRQL
jgi:predicted nucleic acid-binding Zn ribbon protein